MRDPADELPQQTRSKPRRGPRFVLPDGHHDERTAARIVAFLDGPVAPQRRTEASRGRGEPPSCQRELDTRPDWMAALAQEVSRHARYGRPASVLLLELDGPPDSPSVDRVAHGLADLIRAEARETDRAVRLGASSFRLLMPETSGRAARHVAARLERGFQAAHSGRPDRTALRIEIAAPGRGGSLQDALTDAERRLGL